MNDHASYFYLQIDDDVATFDVSEFVSYVNNDLLEINEIILNQYICLEILY